MALRDSRYEILKAAVIEFADRGLSGARMEQIAVRAGFNKALIYRYFKSKEELFTRVLEFKFNQQMSVALAVPSDLGDALEYWFRHAADDPKLVQLIQREALNDDGGLLAHEEFRRRYFGIQIEDLEKRKAQGQIDAVFASAPLLLALSALISFPSFFPNLTRLITGSTHDKAGFQEEWVRFLRALALHLAPRSSTSAEAGGESGASCASVVDD